jgi:hypothetical protein
VYSTQSHYDHIQVNNRCLRSLIARLTGLSNSFVNESRSTKFNVRLTFVLPPIKKEEETIDLLRRSPFFSS